MKLCSHLLIVFAMLHCNGQSPSQVLPDPYTPQLRIAVTNEFTGEPGVGYRFTEPQLARMAQTQLETNRFVSYVKRRWPVERLRAYCTVENQRPESAQNLVAQKTVLETGRTRRISRVLGRIGTGGPIP